ncbi:MAG: hypothetical protein H7X93_07290 [Sphingomonadaceae bacterium]|nr:hypothetical protein [Sphingomonadaceae bacterium]
MKGRAIGAGLAALSMASQAAAQPVCVTAAESDAIFATTLPGIMDNLRERCAPRLPADSVLMARGGAAAERYRAAADAGRALAIAALERVFATGEPAVDDALSGEAMLALFEAGFEAEMAPNLDARGCARAEAIFGAIEPLPAANLTRLISVFMAIGAEDADPGEAPPFRIC